MHPVISLVQAGAGMDMAGRNYDHFTDEEREAVIAAIHVATTSGMRSSKHSITG
jgi:hypothetical protein